ncbi:hypothetical protein BGZ76_011675 [Entomortierella beljakovae]|nr:hypothetical protein BGZ76_011675 [Entomortierella beljakovae]
MLEQAIKDQDLTTAFNIYLHIRRRKFPPDLIQLWYRCQRRLVRLFHNVQLQATSEARVLNTKKLRKLEKNRKEVLTDISERTLKGSYQSEFSATLIDALGKSKTLVQHSYLTNSSTKLKDWREALRILEDWALRSNRRHNPSPVAGSTLDSEHVYALESRSLDSELRSWLSQLMSRLVYSHTYLIRSIIESITDQFGIQPSVEMYSVLLEYYAILGKDGAKEIQETIQKMISQNVAWEKTPVVYEYFLYSLSHGSGNVAEANRVIEEMLANDLVPREETMKAAILCAARSGDVETCSRYIHRMHHDWNLTVSERMKAIILYACAKRGDFEGALEILEHLSGSGTLVASKLGAARTRNQSDDKESEGSISTASLPSTERLENLLDSHDIVNNSNILLALINQTHRCRSGKQVSQEFVKEEVSKVLELFTIITKDPNRVDAQLYSIMMQYLSTLPSPIPGMMYLYQEMCSSEKAKPNNVTFKIMLDACAEQMEMVNAKQLWEDIDSTNVIKDCHIRASYVRGWSRMGHLDKAELYTKEALVAQKQLDMELLRYNTTFAVRNEKRIENGFQPLEMPRPPRRQRVQELISLSVLHELMRGYKQHDRPVRVFEIYNEIEAGKWGRKIQPNGCTLSIVLGACTTGTTTLELIDNVINLVDHILDIKRERWLTHLKGVDQEDEDEDQRAYNKDGGDETKSVKTARSQRVRSHMEFSSITERNQLPILSDVNYQLYFDMLGRHHRQQKMTEVWEDMMKSIESPPSHLTVNLVTEALENVQWGAAPIKRIQRELVEHWPKVDWASKGRSKKSGSGTEDNGIFVDDSVGPGGRFWR